MMIWWTRVITSNHIDHDIDVTVPIPQSQNNRLGIDLYLALGLSLDQDQNQKTGVHHHCDHPLGQIIAQVLARLESPWTTADH